MRHAFLVLLESATWLFIQYKECIVHIPSLPSLSSLKPLCLAAMLCAAAGAQAAITGYTSEAAFLSAA